VAVANAQHSLIYLWAALLMTKRLNSVLDPRKVPNVGRARVAYNFTLSGEANWQLHRMCKATGKSRSMMMESLLLPNYSLLFEKFDEGASFSEVVKTTYYPPDVVRHARREYDAGWKEPEPVHIRALDKKLQIRELEVDKAMIEKASEERVERLRAQTKRIELEHEVRIERTRATAAGRGR
jgi:hypothetical protein